MEAYACSARANSLHGAQAIDDFDGDDIGGSNRFFALRGMSSDDGVEVEQVPQPARQIDVAEVSWIGTNRVAHPNTHQLGIVGQRYVVIVGDRRSCWAAPCRF